LSIDTNYSVDPSNVYLARGRKDFGGLGRGRKNFGGNIVEN